MTFDTEDEEVGTAPEAVGETGPFPDERLVPLAGPPGSLGSASLITPPLEVAALVTQLTALGWEAEAVPAHVPAGLPSVAAQAASPLQSGKRTMLHAWWIAARPQFGALVNGGGEPTATGEDCGDREDTTANDAYDAWDLLSAASWAQRLRQPGAVQRGQPRSVVTPTYLLRR